MPMLARLPSVISRTERTDVLMAMKNSFLLVALLIPALSQSQTCTIDWSKIAGGGSTSTGSTYEVRGTIGHDHHY